MASYYENVLSIGGRTFNLPIFSYSLSVEILSGKATGRSDADLWPMFRVPQGVIKNLEQVEFGLCDDSKQDFIDLIQVLDSFGSVDFLPIRFKTQTGIIEQPMYGASYTQDMYLFDVDGVAYWGNLTVKFIAKQGIK